MALHGRCTLPALNKFLMKNLLMVITFVSVVLGFAIGFGLREVTLNDMAKMWLAMPGYCFLNLLKITIVPLITASVISAVSTMNPRENGKLVGIQLGYLILTNIFGATIGTLLGVAVQRTGSKSDETGEAVDQRKLQTVDIFADFIRNLFPENIVRVTMQKAQTIYTTEPPILADNSTLIQNATILQKRSWVYTDEMNLLGLMVVCFVFGLAASSIGDKGKPFVAFFQSATDIILRILQWFIWCAPIGVLFLMILAIAEIRDIQDTFSKIGFFVLAVVVGLVAQQLIFLPLVCFVVTRKNPYKIYPHCVQAWLVSFASASSACTMPFIYKMMDVPEVGWNRKAANFAIPIAVTINADGSALFICNAIFFLAQLTGADMGVGNIFIVWILTGLTSMALPSVPSASLVSVIIICSAMGIPTTHIGLLFTVEWFLDRLRTTSNVISEILSVSVVDHYYKKLRNESDDPEEEEEELFLVKANNNDSAV